MKKEILREIRKNLVVQNEKMNGMACLRENLRLYIAHKDITLVKLSETAEISMETLKTIIYGKYKTCDIETVAKLAKTLCVTMDELYGFMDKRAANSLSSYQDFLPSRSKQLIDWHISHQIYIHEQHPDQKIISVMTPICNSNGNLKLTNNYSHIDISQLGDDFLPKIFFGITIPCEHYLPTYCAGDTLLIANDRNPLPGEHSIIIVKGNISIVDRRIEDGEVKYYSIRDGRLRSKETPRIEYLGYIATVLEGE